MTLADELCELQRVFKLNQALTERGNATLGDLVELGLATVAGKLATPRGWWSCPWCWRDYVRPGYRPANAGNEGAKSVPLD